MALDTRMDEGRGVRAAGKRTGEAQYLMGALPGQQMIAATRKKTNRRDAGEEDSVP